MPEVTADQMLGQCGVPSIYYLTRVVAPGRIKKAAEMFDGWVMEAYVKKHDIPVSLLGYRERLQLSLPTSNSGLGLTDHTDTSVFAFWGAVARAADFFTARRQGADGRAVKLSGRSQYAQQVEACFGEIAIKYPALVAKRQRKGAPMLPESGGFESVQCFYGIK